MKTSLLAIAVLFLYAAHQDFWLWRDARPFTFGVLPVGIAYHALYCVACAALMAILVKYAWPEDFDR